MSRLPEECCAKCRFYRKWDERVEGGNCRRYPPVFVPHEPSVVHEERDLLNDGGWRYPPMDDDEWCGEYQAKEVAA